MTPPTYITLLIKQPEDPRARQLMHDQITHVIGLYGGNVAGMSPEDEMTLCELLQERLPDHEINDVRQQVSAIHTGQRRHGRRRPASLEA
ncbi:conserved hypothetical protein [Pseudomonas sp. 8Z]|uniref:hypothetical protein n=1 Tax=Pseudomonas sp. 8Z TaxID=2653166 RepID=UPI0012F0E7DB|nr:hypothetical protein [Pseudomonas sp. 8Z]VXC23493.1 conserved hypothetical protein [Pseudomonas sp. 8Z]